MGKHHVNDAATCPLSVSTYPTAAVVSRIPSVFLDQSFAKFYLLMKHCREFRQMNDHIQSLQEQVNNLYANLNALHQSQVNHVVAAPEPVTYRHVAVVPPGPPVPYLNSSPSPEGHSRVARFRGPTSSAFSFEIANTSLQTMGITTSEYITDDGLAAQDGTPPGSPPRNQAPPAQMTVHPPKDPLRTLGRDEVVRLCRLFEEEIGMMYPILDIERTMSKAKLLFDFMDSATRTGLVSLETSGSDALNDDDSLILKMVLAVASTIEVSGPSELGQKLFGTVQAVSGARLWQPVSVKGLILLVMVVSLSYPYLCYRPNSRWRLRTISISTRKHKHIE